MAEFCSICEPEYFDIDLTSIALELTPGHSIELLCEGCNIRAVYKDESGILYLGRLTGTEISLEPIEIEKL
jgi:hypothetical protein